MRFFIIALLIVIPAIVSAQKIKLISGSLDAMKDQREISIEFSYDRLVIGVDVPEEEYIQKKKNAWDLKEPGKGPAFEKYWHESKKSMYELMFAYHFAKSSGLASAKTQAPYTMIVKTRQIEPGWNAGVVVKTAEVQGDIWIVSSSDPATPVAVLAFENCSGEDATGGDFEMARRIQGAYHVAAVAIGKFVAKRIKN